MRTYRLIGGPSHGRTISTDSRTFILPESPLPLFAARDIGLPPEPMRVCLYEMRVVRIATPTFNYEERCFVAAHLNHDDATRLVRTLPFIGAE